MITLDRFEKRNEGNNKTQIKITYFHINEAIDALRTLSSKSSSFLLGRYFPYIILPLQIHKISD